MVLSRGLALAYSAFVILVIGSLSPLMTTAGQSPSLTYQHHDPILITNNGFGTFPGDGSESNPYVIEGLEIDGAGFWTSLTVPCIEIRDCNAHFIIRDNHLRWDGTSGLAVELERCSNGTIENNTIDQIYLGSWLWDCSNCTFSGNSVTTNGGQEEMGLFLLNSGNCSVWGNEFHSNGIMMYGDFLDKVVSNDIASNNTVSGLPIIFIKDQIGVHLDNIVAGQLLVAHCENITISNMNISDVNVGIALYFVMNATVENVDISGTSWDAMPIYNSTDVVVRYCHLYSNGYNGVTFYHVAGAVISNNLIEHNWPAGIAAMFNCSGVVAYNNYLIGNSMQIWGEMILDAGYPTGGNYYSDYVGQDLLSGPNQDLSGPDGIGDVPYLNASQQDRYPLMEPFGGGPGAAFFVSENPSAVGATLVFNASNSWDIGYQNQSLSFRWDFDDDGVWDVNWTTEKTAQWQYPGPGDYTVRLEVRDSIGLTRNTTMHMEVTPLVIPEFTGPLMLLVSILFLVVVIATSRSRRR